MQTPDSQPEGTQQNDSRQTASECAIPPSLAAGAARNQEPEPGASVDVSERSGLVGVGGDPKLVITSSALDLELCELLGEKPSDFVILLADGKDIPGFGTPYDSPAARKERSYLCERLNDAGKDSWWPEFLVNWKNELGKIGITPDSRPVFSLELHRVCVGRSAYLHCAIRLFEELRERVSSWGIGVADGICIVDLTMGGDYYVEKGPDPALTICKAVVRALRTGGGGAEPVTSSVRDSGVKLPNDDAHGQASAEKPFNGRGA